jgi:hypothetical protein
MNNCCICWFFTHIFTVDINLKGLSARRLYKSFGVKGLINMNFIHIVSRNVPYDSPSNTHYDLFPYT